MGHVHECPFAALAANIFFISSMLLAERANMTHPSLTLPVAGGSFSRGIVGSTEMHVSLTYEVET